MSDTKTNLYQNEDDLSSSGLPTARHEAQLTSLGKTQHFDTTKASAPELKIHGLQAQLKLSASMSEELNEENKQAALYDYRLNLIQYEEVPDQEVEIKNQFVKDSLNKPQPQPSFLQQQLMRT